MNTITTRDRISKRMTSNGLANLRQVSGAKVAVASFVIETSGGKLSDLLGGDLWQIINTIFFVLILCVTVPSNLARWCWRPVQIYRAVIQLEISFVNDLIFDRYPQSNIPVDQPFGQDYSVSKKSMG